MKTSARSHQLNLAEQRNLLRGRPFDKAFFTEAVDDLFALLKEMTVDADGNAIDSPQADSAVCLGIETLKAVHDGNVSKTVEQLAALRALTVTTPVFRQVSHQTLRAIPVLS